MLFHQYVNITNIKHKRIWSQLLAKFYQIGGFSSRVKEGIYSNSYGVDSETIKIYFTCNSVHPFSNYLEQLGGIDINNILWSWLFSTNKNCSGFSGGDGYLMRTSQDIKCRSYIIKVGENSVLAKGNSLTIVQILLERPSNMYYLDIIEL